MDEKERSDLVEGVSCLRWTMGRGGVVGRRFAGEGCRRRGRGHLGGGDQGGEVDEVTQERALRFNFSLGSLGSSPFVLGSVQICFMCSALPGSTRLPQSGPGHAAIIETQFLISSRKKGRKRQSSCTFSELSAALETITKLSYCL